MQAVLPLESLEAMLLAAVRMTAFIVIAPPFSHNAIPGRIKATLAVGLALAVTPRLSAGYQPQETGPFLAAVVLELVTGAALGFLVMLLFAAVQSAGGLIDLFGGFAMAQGFDPQSMVNGAQFSRYFHWAALALLVSSDGYQLVLAGLFRSFDAIPLGGGIGAGRGGREPGARRRADVRLGDPDRRPAAGGAGARRHRPGPAHPRGPRAERLCHGLPAEDLPHALAGRDRVCAAALGGCGAGALRPEGARRGVGRMSQDSGERSEKATPERMKEVRSKGKMTRSQDLTAWLGIAAAALMIPGLMTLAEEAGRGQFVAIQAVIANPQEQAALDVLGLGLSSLPTTLAPMFIAVLVVILATAALQGGIRFKKFKIDPSNLNLVSGFTRVFGFQALWQGIKALLKVVVIGLVLWSVVSSLMPLLLQSGSLPIASLLGAGGGGAAALIRASVIAGLVLAALDVFVVMRRNRKHTRMTRKEVTDENKRSDGDPLIKSQRRSRQMAMSRNRMMAGIADADVVIVNPVHVAVALKYEPGQVRARSWWPRAPATSPRASARRRAPTRCRWSRTCRWPGTCTRCARSATRSRRTPTTRWPGCSRS